MTTRRTCVWAYGFVINRATFRTGTRPNVHDVVQRCEKDDLMYSWASEANERCQRVRSVWSAWSGLHEWKAKRTQKLSTNSGTWYSFPFFHLIVVYVTGNHSLASSQSSSSISTLYLTSVLWTFGTIIINKPFFNFALTSRTEMSRGKVKFLHRISLERRWKRLL